MKTHFWSPGDKKPSNVKPGDTVVLAEGRWPSVELNFQGLSGRHIYITNAPGKKVIFDQWAMYGGKYYCNLFISGSYQTIKSNPQGGSIEITDNGPQTRDPSNQRPWAIRVGTVGATERAIKNTLVNLRIKGTGGSIFDTRSIDTTAYGCITTDWGWFNEGRRGQGHAWYVQNVEGRYKHINNCFAGWGHGRGVQVYGNGKQVRDVLIEDSIFATTSLHAPPPLSVQPCISVGAESGGVADGCVIRRCEVNQQYPYPNQGGYGHQAIAFVGPGKRIEIRDSYISGVLNEVNSWNDVIVKGNTQHYRHGSGQPDWATKYPDNSFIREVGPPEPSTSEKRIRVIPNAMEAGRAHVAIWNWPDDSSAQIPVDAFALPYEFYRAENLATGQETIFSVLPNQKHITFATSNRFEAFLITKVNLW